MLIVLLTYLKSGKNEALCNIICYKRELLVLETVMLFIKKRQFELVK